jgi:hypothetical protein
MYTDPVFADLYRLYSHPTGIAVPIGVPVRVRAEGRVDWVFEFADQSNWDCFGVGRATREVPPWGFTYGSAYNPVTRVHWGATDNVGRPPRDTTRTLFRGTVPASGDTLRLSVSPTTCWTEMTIGTDFGSRYWHRPRGAWTFIVEPDDGRDSLAVPQVGVTASGSTATVTGPAVGSAADIAWFAVPYVSDSLPNPGEFWVVDPEGPSRVLPRRSTAGEPPSVSRDGGALPVLSTRFALESCRGAPTCALPGPDPNIRVVAVVSTTGGARYAAAVAPLVPRFTASCTPSVITRGDPVDCQVGGQGIASFRVVEAIAQPTATSLGSVHVPVNRSVSPPGRFGWAGDGVSSTNVEFVVEYLAEGSVRVDTVRAGFEVMPRAWLPYAIQALPRDSVGLDPSGLYPIVDPPGRELVDLSTGRVSLTATFAYISFVGLAKFQTEATALASDSTYTRVVVGGPNSGLAWYVLQPEWVDDSYVLTYPPLRTTTIRVPPGTVGALWLAWQDSAQTFPGTPPLAYRCGLAGVRRLDSLTRIHEGLTGAAQSHWGLARDSVAAARLHGTLEAVVGRRFQATRDSIRRLLEGFDRRLSSAQASFDSADYRRMYGTQQPPPIGSVGALGCILKNSP